MLFAAANNVNGLLFLSYIGHIRLEELERRRAEVKSLIAQLAPGFRLLADFTNMDKMDANCTPELGRMMEVLDQAGMGMVARVIPDPSKDVGMNILAHFHYRNHHPAVVCETFAEAIRALSL